MISHTIECFDGQNPNPITEPITLPTNECYRHTFTVKCDDEDDNNSFELSYYGDDDFVINRNRCELDIYIKSNLTPYDKHFYIVCTHTEDADVYSEIEIIQSKDDYKLDIKVTSDSCCHFLDYYNIENANEYISQADYDELNNEEKQKYAKRYKLELESIITNCPQGKKNDINYNFYEEKNIEFIITGGNSKYRIKSIFMEHFEENTEGGNILIQEMFDNGFLYTLFTDKMVLRNYGRTFLKNDNFYEITFCHDNLESLTIKLKIVYKQLPSSNRNFTVLSNLRNQNITEPIKSDIYLPLETLREKYTVLSTFSIRNNNNYDIVIDNDVYSMIGKSTLSIPFNVLENEEESNLMVQVKTSAIWCSAKLDDTNRILNITITSNPTCERNCIIKISIMDIPKVYKTLLLKNKPF